MIDVESLARWSVGLDPASLPPATAERVRLQIGAVLGSLLYGLRIPAVERSRAAFVGMPATQGRSKRKGPIPAPAEALAPWLSMASMALDFDDYLLFGHTGHSAVVVPLVFALERGAPLGDLLAAAAAGNEIGGRFGGYALIGPHNGQMWSHIHLGATVVALARLAGDEPGVAARALGLAFSIPPFLLPPAFFGSSSKLLTAALPIRQALLALGLARAGGLGAPAAVFDSKIGFGRHFAYAPAEGFFDGLGSVWLTDTLAVKRVPGCAYVSSAAEAAANLGRQARAALGRAIAPDDVERVEVSATVLTTAMDQAAQPHRLGALSAVEVTFSTALTTALALLDESYGPSSLDEDRLRRDETAIRALASRVRVRHDLPRTMKLVDGVARPMELLGLLGDLPAGQAPRVGLDLLGRLPGALGGSGAAEATTDRSPFRLFRDRATLDTFRSVGQLVSGALGRRSGGARYSVADARPGDVRFAASAGILATIRGEVFEAECDIPPGAPGSPIDLHEVVRERLRGAFPAAGLTIDADEFVGRLLSAPLDAPVADLLGPVAAALK